MPTIQIADKSTLDNVDTKIGSSTDVASSTPTTIFSGINQLVSGSPVLPRFRLSKPSGSILLQENVDTTVFTYTGSGYLNNVNIKLDTSTNCNIKFYLDSGSEYIIESSLNGISFYIAYGITAGFGIYSAVSTVHNNNQLMIPFRSSFKITLSVPYSGIRYSYVVTYLTYN